jgi:hypothetical protein
MFFLSVGCAKIALRHFVTGFVTRLQVLQLTCDYIAAPDRGMRGVQTIRRIASTPRVFVVKTHISCQPCDAV